MLNATETGKHPAVWAVWPDMDLSHSEMILTLLFRCFLEEPLPVGYRIHKQGNENIKVCQKTYIFL